MAQPKFPLPLFIGVCVVAGGCIAASMGFWQAEADNADDRTWKELKTLAQQLGAIGDRSYGTTILIHTDGSVYVSIDRDGTSYRGRGPNPWAAAEDLAGKSEAIRQAIEQALRPGS